MEFTFTVIFLAIAYIAIWVVLKKIDDLKKTQKENHKASLNKYIEVKDLLHRVNQCSLTSERYIEDLKEEQQNLLRRIYVLHYRILGDNKNELRSLPKSISSSRIIEQIIDKYDISLKEMVVKLQSENRLLKEYLKVEVKEEPAKTIITEKKDGKD